MASRVFTGNFTRHIVRTLGKSIALGEYQAGMSLKAEADLCQDFDASRTVLREAVKMLTAKGMLDARPRRGTIVLPESEWNLSDPDILNWLLDRKGSLSIISEFIEMRIAIEPAACVLAANNLNQDTRDKLSNAYRRMVNASNGEDDQLESDISFHLCILEATGNRFFWNMRHTIEVALRFSIRITNRSKGAYVKVVENHEKILNMILNNNAQGAENEMRTLLIEAKMLLNKALEKESKKK